MVLILHKIIFLLTSSITIHAVQKMLLPTQNYKEQEILQCVCKIYAEIPDFTTKVFTQLNKSGTNIDFLNEISSFLHKGTVINTEIDTHPSKDNFGTAPSTEVIIVINDDLTHIYKRYEDVDKVFSKAIYQYMLRRVLVIDRNGYVYSVNRFEEHCGRNNSKELLFHCENFNSLEVSRVYESRPIEDLLGCPVYGQYDRDVIAYTNIEQNLNQSVLPQIEYKLLLEAVKSLNATLILNKSRNPNPSEYTIFFGGRTNHYLTGLYPLFMDEYMMVVPHVQKLPNWQGLLYVFDSTLWIAVFVCSILFTVCTYTIAQFTQRPENYDNITYTIMSLYGILIGQGAPEPKYLIMKIIFTLWLFFTFIIMNAYNGFFLAHILLPMYQKPVNSIDEIFNAGYTIAPTFRDGYEISDLISNDLYPNIIERTIDMTFSNLDKYDKSVMVLKRSEIDYIRTSLPDLMPQVHTIPLSKYWTWMEPLTQGHPIKEILNSRIIWLYEMGFADKWLQDILASQKGDSEDGEFENLTLEHVLLAFFILAAGAVISIFAFMYEHYSNNQRGTNLVKHIVSCAYRGFKSNKN